MTDQKDYLRLPEVLEACGYGQVQNPSMAATGEWLWSKDCKYAIETPTPTLSELWEGLCKAWSQRWIDPLDADARDLLENRLPGLSGMSHVVLWEPGETHFFTAKEYGTLPNAVAAALHWVLQQKEG